MYRIRQSKLKVGVVRKNNSKGACKKSRFGVMSNMKNKLLIFLACSILTTASNGLKQSADIGNANYPPSSDEIHNDPQKMDRLYIPSGTYKVTNKDPHHRTYSEPHPSDSKSDRSRFRRDSNENFTSIVDRMEKISRVVNGISIQQGIINGTIKPDVLIAELLNFGSVSLSDIDGIKLDELSKVVQDIQSLSTTLAKNDEVARMEKRLTTISLFVRESNGVSELKEPSKEYSNALIAWKTLNVDWTKFNELNTYYLGFLNAIETFKSQSVAVGDINLGISTLTYLVNSLAAGNLDTYSDTLKSDVLRKADSIFAPFISFQKSVASFRKNENLLMYSSTRDRTPLGALRDKLNALNEVGKGAKAHLSNVSKLGQLFIGRHHRSSGNILIHTNGFPNGFKDLEQVSDDLKDPWIEQAVDGQSESLAKALVQLRTLARATRSVDETMGPKTNAETVSMADIHKKVTMLSEMNHPLADVAGKLQDIQNACSSVNVQPDSQDAFVLLQNQIVEFTKKLKAVDHVIAVTHTLNTDKNTQLTAVSHICKSHVGSNYAETQENLKTSKEYQEIVDLILPLNASLGLIGKSASLEPLSNILQNYTTIATYVKESTSFTSMLKNLQGIKELSQVDEVLDALRSHRDIKISNFDPVAAKLEKVRPKLKDLQSSIGNMKGADSLEKKSLVEIRDLFKDSQNIGGATRVFRSMRMVKKKNQTVMTPAMEKLIQNQLKHVSQPQQDQLNQLLGLDKELTTLIAAIDKIETSVTPSPSTDLVSLWPIFSLANGSQGIPMDFLEISETIDELSKDPNLKSHQQDLLKIKDDLDSLDSLGLDYSKHQTAIKETEESLKQLDLFFELFKKKITPKNVSQDRKGPLEKRPTGEGKNPSSDSRRSEKIEQKGSHHQDTNFKRFPNPRDKKYSYPTSTKFKSSGAAKKPKLTDKKDSGVDAKTLYVAMGGAPKSVPYYSEEEEEEEEEMDFDSAPTSSEAAFRRPRIDPRRDPIPYFCPQQYRISEEIDFEPRIPKYDLSSEIQKQPERVPYFPEAPKEKEEPEEAEPKERQYNHRS
ncbi:hypothetical protein GCK72_011142 [Caenorhabditis remanei]|uniref:Domain of unknown function WSN domain-containing protein n=1 Tax=Caenorhabditis remanei TaxID=31234 RepID=A0A6A5H568_CAERE|nr:hypothetical protein GCK72_011142 [Caenorhabditis remanei]KAF1762878.1 hypothetical protein GCK72_011142 [Caenorhabditis remanei]